jgi:hypothetical protein
MAQRDNNQALINSQQPKSLYQRIRLPLDDGLKRGQSALGHFKKPFQGLWVYDVSSSTVEVSVRFNSRHDTGAIIPLKKNMVINHPHQVMDAEFIALPQKDQWVELVFSTDSEINIGNIEQQVTGEVGLEPETLQDLTGPRLEHGAYSLPDNEEIVLLKSAFQMGGSFSSILPGSFAYVSLFSLNNSNYNQDNGSSPKLFRVPSGYEFLPLSLRLHIMEAQAAGTLAGAVPLFVGSLKNSAADSDVVPYLGGTPITYINSRFNNSFGSQQEFNPYVQASQFKEFYFDGTFNTWSSVSSNFATSNGPAVLNENERVAVGVALDAGGPPAIDAVLQFTVAGKLRKLQS